MLLEKDAVLLEYTDVLELNVPNIYNWLTLCEVGELLVDVLDSESINKLQYDTANNEPLTCKLYIGLVCVNIPTLSFNKVSVGYVVLSLEIPIHILFVDSKP